MGSIGGRLLPVPLNVRSQHSLGFGTATVEELAERAAKLGLSALALTDVETLAGQIRFHDACRACGIKAISGVELRDDSGRGRGQRGDRKRPGEKGTGRVERLEPGQAEVRLGADRQTRRRLVLLARDEQGYTNLCRIVSRRRTARGAGDLLEDLDGESVRGLFLLCDDLATLRRLEEIGGVQRDDLYLLAKPGTAQESPTAAGNDAPFRAVPHLDLVTLESKDRDLHALLVAIRQGMTVGEVKQAGLDEAARRPFDAETLRLFAAMPGAIQESHRVAEACHLDLAKARRRIPPRLPGIDEAEAAGELVRRCEIALQDARARGRLQGREYDARLQRELATIEQLGFVDYLLAVAEIVRGARGLGVPTAGRGSAAGSLVTYLLGITQIDPVEQQLLFERFLHRLREAPPDIDLDVASTGRASLNAWVAKRFGRERVAGVASYGTFRARSAVRAGLAALGMAPSVVDTAARNLEPGDASGEEEARLIEQALSRSIHGPVRNAAPLMSRLVGLPSHLAAHPGGIVIGDQPLAALAPLERAPGGTIVTQYDLRSVERAGFLKLDLLGNHFLSEKQEALLSLARREGKPDREQDGRSGVGSETPVIPRDDEATRQTLNDADTVGCFQVESPAVRSVLRQLPIRDFHDLVAALAVVRPGAAAGAAKERFVCRARGEEAYEPLGFLGPEAQGERYDELRRRLARTHGVLLYDEDIIRLLASVGGISLAEADTLRTAIVSAGEDARTLKRLGGDFAEWARFSGAGGAVAERAWQAATRFASYSFAEAHAASYAALAWEAAWLRTHAPADFGAALLNHHRGIYPLRTVAAAVERWGVRLMPPSVNESQLPSVFEPGKNSVRVGLGAVKGLTRRTARDIIESRPFRDLGQLLERARPAKRELRALLLAGACDDLPPLTAAGYPFVHEVVLEGLEGEAPPKALEEALERVARQPAAKEEGERLQAYQALMRVRNELRYLEMHVSDHPMRLLRKEAERLGCLRSDALSTQADRGVRFAGLLSASHRVPASRGEWRFLTLEDEAGLVEALLYPNANARLSRTLTTPGPYLLEGVVREERGDVHLVVSDLKPFHERE